jgi:hypothetical protein
MRIDSRVSVILTALLTSAAYAAPATKPSQADQRSKQFQAAAAGANSFELTLDYHGDQDKPFYGLTLSVQKPAGDDPVHPALTITPQQARKIITQLSADGFLSRAAELPQNQKPPSTPKGPCYTLRVACEDQAGRHEFIEDLGWGLPMLKRLDGLRGVLDDDAAKPMDTLLGRLSGHRKQWEREEDDPAATGAADPGRLKSFKGWELYAWRKEGQTYYALMKGTNDLKADERIAKAAIKGFDQTKVKLAELETGQTVTIWGRRHGESAASDLGTEVEAYCRKLALKPQLP